MTWTYAGDPSANTRDHVRFLIGDTDTDDQLVTDEEIAGTLSLYSSSPHRAAARICRSLAAKFSRQVDTSADGVSVSRSQRGKQFLELAGDLEREAKQQQGHLVGAFMGGQTGAVTDSTPNFDIGMHDDLPGQNVAVDE